MTLLLTGPKPPLLLVAPQETLLRVQAPGFVAGVILRDGVVTDAAPILRRLTIRRTRAGVEALAARRGWQTQEL